MLYKYIFYKVYFFYIRVFKEKEIPHWFASTIVTLILVMNILAVIEVFLYLFQPELIITISEYFKYFSLLILAGVMSYTNMRKRYLSFIKDIDKLPKNKRRSLGYISFLYVLVVFVCFFGMSEIIRDFYEGKCLNR